MTNDEILTKINDLLDQHVRGIRGYIRQEPYLSDLFKLFAAAYANAESAGPDASHITGDGLIGQLGDLSQATNTPDNYPKKLELLRKFGAMWSEWEYAWKMHPQLYHPAK